MRSRIARHLEPLLHEQQPDGLAAHRTALLSFAVAQEGAGDWGAEGAELWPAGAAPPEFNWRDYAAMLLGVAAEIEHSLMVQYLFAAYSLGGPQVPQELRGEVQGWQTTILGIAKEEMGHLVSVQNLRTALGLPLHLDREDYPWGSGFYPFQFTLQRLTLDSLATYVCAESPPGWDGPEAQEIRARAAQEAHGEVNRVGALYEAIIQILSDRSRIADTAFDAATVPRQASFDEWGRGYREGAREAAEPGGAQSPDLLILAVSSRDTAIDALNEIGEQGEALNALPESEPADAGESSHFVRFLTIYRALSRLDPVVQESLSRPVPENPAADAMSTPEARWFAHLFNLRYRMLLVNIAHAFEVPAPPSEGTHFNARGALVNRTFAEMYNLRVIAGILVEIEMPGEHGPVNAAPPFQMPYTLDLPRDERHRWALHRDMLEASAALIEQLGPVRAPYLSALSESDAIALSQVNRILGGQSPGVAAGIAEEVRS